MARFDRQIEMALRLIKKNGQKIQWLQKTKVISDPLKPWIVTEASVTYEPIICFLPLDKDGREFLSQFANTEAIVGSYYGLMGQVGFDPSKADNVIRDGVNLQIESIDLLSPNGQKILYTMIFNG